ncbi:MAG TPA: hypothetical protein VD999_03985 [Vitreimonas sp.]|nr:hypothetical protein [Vitreimonas sp.]
MAIFLVHYLVSGQAVYGDGIGYYAHLHTWVIDRDFDHTNEYKHIYTPVNNNALTPTVSPVIQIVATTQDGRAENHYSPGVALLLLPFYITGHLVAQLLVLGGISVSVTGYGDIYQISSGIGAILYVILGLYLLERLVRFHLADATISRLTIVAMFLATNLLYYGSFDVINSHFASFFLSVLFFYIFYTQPSSLKKEFGLGLVAGWLTTNRLQDGAVVIIWGLQKVLELYQRRLTITTFLRQMVLFGSGWLVMILPLLLHWQHVFGDGTAHTYWRNFENDYADKRLPSVLGSLFHPVTGLFSRTPLLGMGFMYYLWLSFKQWAEGVQWLMMFFGLQVIVITLQGGWFAAAYGGRMYISSLVFFAVVLAKMLQHLRQVRPSYSMILIGVFILLNIISVCSFVLFEKGAEGGVTGTELKTLERIKNLPNVL